MNVVIVSNIRKVVYFPIRILRLLKIFNMCAKFHLSPVCSIVTSFTIVSLILLSAISCGTSRLSVRVKSNADGTLNSTISVSGSVTGGTTTPNVSVALPDSVKLVNYVPQPN